MKTIGIKLADGSFYPVMEEGSAQTKTLELTTAHNNQTCVMVDLYRSKTCSMDDAEYIDTLKIENLKEHPNGEPSIAFNVGLDENGELTTSIDDPETGASSSSEITLVSRTVEERLHTDDYSISDATLDDNALSDNSDNGKLGAAALGAVAGAGLMAAAAGILNKKNDDDEAAETENEALANDETIINDETFAGEESLSNDDFNLGDPSFNNTESTDDLVLPDLDDNSIFEDNSVTKDEVENTDFGSEEAGIVDPFADEPIMDEPATDETIADDIFNDEQSVISTDSITEDVFGNEQTAIPTDPLTEDAFAEEPIVDEPSADETIADDIFNDEQGVISTGSITEDAFADEPSIEQPIVDEPAADETITDDTFNDEQGVISTDSITENDFGDEQTAISTDPLTEDTFAEEPIVDEPAADETIIENKSLEDTFAGDDLDEDPITEDDNFDLPDFPEEESFDDSSSQDLFDDEPAPSAVNGLSFTGLYDKETAMGESSNYENENNGKKAKNSVIICIICAIICIVATALILFVVPSRCNLLTNHKNKKEETPIEKTVEPVKPAESQPAKVEDTNLAKKDEVVVIEKAEEVKPLPPPAVEKEENKVTYKIKWGDTLWDIADNYYKNPWKYKKIANYNNIKNPDHIISGTVITIPEE